jgi:hypothetical protein
MGDRWKELSYSLGGWSNRFDHATRTLVDGPKGKWKPNMEVLKTVIRFVKRTKRILPKAQIKSGGGKRRLAGRMAAFMELENSAGLATVLRSLDCSLTCLPLTYSRSLVGTVAMWLARDLDFQSNGLRTISYYHIRLWYGLYYLHEKILLSLSSSESTSDTTSR